MGLSSRQLGRLFRQRLATSPAAFYRSLRLEAGRRLLETTDRRVVDIALACGFESRTAFTRAYVDLFGTKPSQTRAAG